MTPFPDKKYDIIYADPPWRYSFQRSNNRKIENQYLTMTLDDIINLPVIDISKMDSVLFLWTTTPKLIEGLTVLKAWGFKYKTNGVWDKKIIGMGYWFRGQHELLLVGTRGKVSPPMPKDRNSSVYKEQRTRHSKKPDFYRKWIEQSFPDKIKIELFAREIHDGWDVWGNEIEPHTITIKDIIGQ